MSSFEEEMMVKEGENFCHRGGKTKSQINEEYFQALEQWLNDVRTYKYSCNFFAGFPYTMMAQQISVFPWSQTQNVNVNNVSPSFVFTNEQQPPQTENATQYTIPPLWKRFIAETVDFILLFIMKLAITFIAVDFFDFLDGVKYESFQQADKLDFKLILEVTSEITFLEVAHRLIVCLYEGFFLRKGVHNQIGGATPGKTFMGIKVIFCNSIEQVENQPNVVKVIPAKNLGFGWSFARAFLKNLVLAVLFPICVPFFNKFNRTAYDILCHSVVVEDSVRPNRNR